MLKLTVRAAYGAYAWVALLGVVLPCCGLLALVPGVHRRRNLTRHAARLFFLAIGSPVRLEGEDVAPHFPCVVVANHASYLDGIILTAALPPRFTYLIKQEMERVPVAGFLLRRIGSAFVRRTDHGHRSRVARELVALAQNGDALAFFPEGTFDAAPGLKPFQLGAFSAAARAGLPVVPVIIQGSRGKLPSGSFLPAPGGLRVRICPPVHPHGFTSPRELMAAAREAMLHHLEEPDLALEEAVLEQVAGAAYIPE